MAHPNAGEVFPGVLVPWWSVRRGGLFHAVEAELRIAMPNQPLAAKTPVGFFEQRVPRVFRDNQGLGIQQM
jgi:hypothetical protein